MQVMKPWYEVTEEDQDAIMNATTWNYADLDTSVAADTIQICNRG